MTPITYAAEFTRKYGLLNDGQEDIYHDGVLHAAPKYCSYIKAWLETNAPDVIEDDFIKPTPLGEKYVKVLANAIDNLWFTINDDLSRWQTFLKTIDLSIFDLFL